MVVLDWLQRAKWNWGIWGFEEKGFLTERTINWALEMELEVIPEAETPLKNSKGHAEKAYKRLNPPKDVVVSVILNQDGNRCESREGS